MVLALGGIKVVEVATMAAVPMAGRLLGDWGADVVHVERLGTGDPWRGWLTGGGTVEELPPEFHYHFWENYNRNKRSVAVDVSQEDGREIVYKLVKGADVFLTNMRPYELEKFKMEYDTLNQLNPGLIYGSLTGYGKKGPEIDAPGQDTVAFWARSGFLYRLQQCGRPPASPGFRTLAAGDKLTAIALACGIILALLVRERTGIGQEVDISLFHTAVFALLPVALALSNEVPDFGIGIGEELLEREDVSPLHISFETKDERWLQLSLAPPDLYWSRFCQAIKREDLEHDPKFESFEARRENQTDLFHILEKVFRSKTLDEWKTPLDEARMLWDPIQSPQEVVNDPQARANDFFVPYDHPTFGQIDVVANPIKLTKTPATIRMPAPEFGQHTEEVLLELGYSWEDISQFKEQGLIA